MSTYFDASDLLLHLTHTATVTGIQRVTQQAIACTPKSSDARPVFFSFETERFYELPASLFDFESDKNQNQLRRIGLHLALTLQSKPSGQKSIIRRLRDRIREYQLATRIPFGRDIRVPGLKPVKFERGDQLVILGAIWGMNGYVDNLRDIALRSGVALTFFCHDMVPVRLPHFVEGDTAQKFRKYMQGILPFCSRFLCNSESTKADLQDYLNEHRSTIATKVVPLAHELISPSAGIGNVSHLGSLAVLGSKYALCVGTVEPRKNHLRLALAFQAASKELGKGALRLVVAGKRGWGSDEFYRLMEDTKCLEGQISLIENPSDAELALLYRSCDFTVYPSLFEGWGLPVGESLWFRKRCIASCAGAIPEVGTDAVDYFDPLCVSSIAAAIVRHATEPATIAHFSDKVAKKHLRSWANFGTDLATALDRRDCLPQRAPVRV